MRSSRSAPDPLDPGFRGFAHRGRHGPFPFVENSLTAFAAALEMGAGIECDVRLTADEEVVVFHDSDAARICGQSRIVEQSTLAELRTLMVGNHPLPTLGELLALVDGRTPLLAEIKYEGLGNRWHRALGPLLANYRGPVGVMSFDAGVIGWIRHKLPQVRRGLVVPDSRGALARWIAMRAAQPHFLAVETKAVGRRWVAAARRDMPVYCWTVRDPGERRRCAPLVDALIWETDGRP